MENYRDLTFSIKLKYSRFSLDSCNVASKINIVNRSNHLSGMSEKMDITLTSLNKLFILMICFSAWVILS